MSIIKSPQEVFPCSIVIMEKNGDEGCNLSFGDKTWCLIGSNKDCDIRIAFSHVAPLHALVFVKDSRVYLQGLDKTFPVHHVQLSEQLTSEEEIELSPDDTFVIGQVLFKIKFGSTESPINMYLNTTKNRKLRSKITYPLPDNKVKRRSSILIDKRGAQYCPEKMNSLQFLTAEQHYQLQDSTSTKSASKDSPLSNYFCRSLSSPIIKDLSRTFSEDFCRSFSSPNLSTQETQERTFFRKKEKRLSKTCEKKCYPDNYISYRGYPALSEYYYTSRSTPSLAKNEHGISSNTRVSFSEKILEAGAHYSPFRPKIEVLSPQSGKRSRKNSTLFQPIISQSVQNYSEILKSDSHNAARRLLFEDGDSDITHTPCDTVSDSIGSSLTNPSVSSSSPMIQEDRTPEPLKDGPSSLIEGMNRSNANTKANNVISSRSYKKASEVITKFNEKIDNKFEGMRSRKAFNSTPSKPNDSGSKRKKNIEYGKKNNFDSATQNSLSADAKSNICSSMSGRCSDNKVSNQYKSSEKSTEEEDLKAAMLLINLLRSTPHDKDYSKERYFNKNYSESIPLSDNQSSIRDKNENYFSMGFETDKKVVQDYCNDNDEQKDKQLVRTVLQDESVLHREADISDSCEQKNSEFRARPTSLIDSSLEIDEDVNLERINDKIADNERETNSTKMMEKNTQLPITTERISKMVRRKENLETSNCDLVVTQQESEKWENIIQKLQMMRVTDLRKLLRSFRLETKGLKQVLINRITEHSIKNKVDVFQTHKKYQKEKIIESTSEEKDGRFLRSSIHQRQSSDNCTHAESKAMDASNVKRSRAQKRETNISALVQKREKGNQQEAGNNRNILTTDAGLVLYKSKTVRQLREYLRTRNLNTQSKMRKHQLIDHLITLGIAPDGSDRTAKYGNQEN